jgi:hypothetical protein
MILIKTRFLSRWAIGINKLTFQQLINGNHMNTLLRFVFLMCVFVFSSNVKGQISNLVVNGSSTYFTMSSGSEISWRYNLPVGDTATLAFWIDVNGNATIDPVTDVLWQSFYQIDGQNNYKGPPDMDDSVNGQIRFAMPIGLAPAEYIMSFTNNNSTATIPGTITPLLSPVFTISGTVTVPPGKSAQYLVLNLENNDDNGGKFWCAITDASGNFSMHMDSDTSGNPWSLKIDNEFRLSPAIQIPNERYLTLDAGVTTNYSGNNFDFIQAAAEINGTVNDEDGNPIIGIDVYIDGSYGNLHRNTMTDITGSFRIGFLSNELPASDVWLGSGNTDDSSIVSAYAEIPTVNSGNVLTKNLKVYRTNSTISGQVALGGNPPNMNMEIFGYVSDTGYVRTYTDLNGNYTLKVSNKLFNYNVGPQQLPPNYQYYSLIAHPGQANVNFNFNLTDIKQNQLELPDEFLLLPNFPNPFNPSTKIRWQSPIGIWQTLKIFDMLGNEVATLVNEFKSAGTYELTWNTGHLPSGVYFCRLQAGSFIQTMKLMLMR